jgi:carbamoyl-phosphate synthase large subunit
MMYHHLMGWSWNVLMVIMSNNIRILVTGAGAVLGQGILRSLNHESGKIENIEIHSADPDIRSSGHWLAQKAHVIPMANDPNYGRVLLSLIKSERIDFVFIGTDVELLYFSKNKISIEELTGVKIIVSPEKVVEIANNKYLTACFLRDNGFPFPNSVMANDEVGVESFLKENSFPLLAKPVDGARSKGVIIVKGIDDIKSILSDPQNLVIQEYLQEGEGEFTSGAVVINGRCTSVVTLKRDLRDGNTYRAYYKKDYERFTSFISNVAEKLGVEGPVNFQFRISKGVPKIFEINGRFSGTTPLRFMFGFNEVNAILRHYIFGEKIKKPSLREGAVLRTWADLFIDEGTLDAFSEMKIMVKPKSTYFGFKS